MSAPNLPSQELVDSFLKNGSANSAYKDLTDLGFDVSLSKLHTRVSQLIAGGKREILHNSGGDMTSIGHAVTDGEIGSLALLRAQIRTGQVFGVAMARWEARHGRAAA